VGVPVRGRSAAVWGTAIVALFLLIPSWIFPAHPILQAFGTVSHAIFFAALAWLWERYLPCGARGLLLFAMMALFAALLEWAQSYIGRSAEWSDWLYGLGGAACICLTWRIRSRRWIRGILLLSLCCLPMIWAGALLHMERSAFPVLLEPEAVWSRKNWILNGVIPPSPDKESIRWDVASPEKVGIRPAYPGAFRRPACVDWRRGSIFSLHLFWPDSASAIFAIRVDDKPNNPPYAERFQREFSVTQGWNSIQIPMAELQQTPGGRLLDIQSICHWGVFLVEGPSLDYFLLGVVQLEQE